MLHQALAMPNQLHIREHTMPQANDKYKTSLETLRNGIDAIDAEIAELLKQRAEIVAEVGKLKEGQQVTGSYIRARREAVMLRKLLGLFEETDFPRAAVAAIWRTIIGASTYMESPLALSILLHGEDASPHYLAREYFGSFIPATLQHSMVEVLREIENNPHTIGIVPYAPGSDSPCWWDALAEAEGETAPVVFAVMPFVRSRKDITPPPTALALGRVELTPTGDDETLLTLRTATPAKEANWVEWCKLALAEIKLEQATLSCSPKGDSALLTVKGFLYGNAGLINALQQAVSKASGTEIALHCIGAYGTPYRHPDISNKA